MASLLSPRRTDAELTLRATTPTDPVALREEPADRPRIGWWLAALLGALTCLATGWVLVAGLAVLGWVTGEPGSLRGALEVGTRLWLTGHGVAVDLAGIPVTLVPWGATALFALLLWRSAAFAARSARPDRPARPGWVALVLVVAYLLPVLAVAEVYGRPAAAPGHLLAVSVVLLGASAAGAARALDVHPTRRWPAWARSLPRAVLGVQLVLLAAGLAVLVTAVLVHLDRVLELHDRLAPGVTGTIALVAAQLALLPNACVWAASYALGGGFTLGNGSVVAPAGTDLGALPGLPVLGALPANGPGPTGALWWLAAGVLAGVVAAWLVVRSRPRARFDETALVGGLSGLLGALVFVTIAWTTSGDLGGLRLAGLGPLLLPLLVMAVSTLGLAGMLTGLLLGLVSRYRAAAGRDQEPAAAGGRSLRRRGRQRAGATALTPAAPAGPAEEPTQVLRRGTRSEDPERSG